MALSCFDEAIAIPTEHAQTLAVRTQQMLQHEFGITKAADPLGGSWYVERLTDELEAEARRLIEHIDELGGAVAAIESGFYQQVIADEAYERERRIAAGEDVVVGVNRYADEAARLPERFDVPPDLASHQRRAAGGAARRARPAGGRRGARAARRRGGRRARMRCPRSSPPSTPRRPSGEICGALRQVFGDYRPAVAAQI